MERELALLQEDLSGSPAEVARLHCQIAELHYATHDDLETTVLHYTSALESSPHFDTAVSGLEELISSEEVQSQIADVLEGVYRASNAHEKLVDIREIQYRYCTKKGERIALLEELSSLYGQEVEDPHRAFRTNGRIFGLKPAHKPRGRSYSSLPRNWGCGSRWWTCSRPMLTASRTMDCGWKSGESSPRLTWSNLTTSRLHKAILR